MPHHKKSFYPKSNTKEIIKRTEQKAHILTNERRMLISGPNQHLFKIDTAQFYQFWGIDTVYCWQQAMLSSIHLFNYTFPLK